MVIICSASPSIGDAVKVNCNQTSDTILTNSKSVKSESARTYWFRGVIEKAISCVWVGTGSWVPVRRQGLLASTDHSHLWLFCRPDLSHLLLLLCLAGCCDHPLHVHAISDHQSLHADLHWEGETSWWVPKCPVLSELAGQKSACTACSASINFGSSR